MESNSRNNGSHLSGFKKPSSLDNCRSVSNSLAEPRDMYRNCKSSLSDRRAEPSAIFTGIDTAARLICEVSPYFSLAGNEAVSEYNTLTKPKLLFQTSRFWCGFIHLSKIWVNIILTSDAYNQILINGTTNLLTGKSPFPINHFLFPISYSPFSISLKK